MAEPQAAQTPPTSIWANFPEEIIHEIYGWILADDHARRDVLALLKVNKHFNNTLKKRVQLALVSTLRNDGVDNICPSGNNNHLPSMVRCLILCQHGPCAHTQQRLGLTSPNLNIKDLFIMPSPPDIDRTCQEPSSCEPLEVLRPESILIVNPLQSFDSTVHKSIVKNSVKHIIYMLGPQSFHIQHLHLTTSAILWYSFEYNSATNAAIFFAPPMEHEVADDDVPELQRLRGLAVQIHSLLVSFLSMMATNALQLKLTVVNAGDLHIRIISHCADGRLIESPQDRQGAVQRWLAGQVQYWPREYRVRMFEALNRVRFITGAEWRETQRVR